MRTWLVTALLCSATVVGQPAAAQSLEQRMLDAPTSVVRMSYAAREGVCGNGRNWVIGTRRDPNWLAECVTGPVRLQLDKDAERIVALQLYVGGEWLARADATDLGDVPAEEASEFLLDLARTATPGVAKDAIMPAVIAAAPDPWPALLDLSRSRSLDRRVREQAIFWLGQSAAREATEGLTALAVGDETTEVQKAAVFALSQRDEPERIDRLIGVARTHSNPEVVKSAVFWLADSEDERAIDFFEEVLTN